MYPEPICTWQFNLKFDLKKDTYNIDSINLLASCGIDFDSLASRGIPHSTFGEYFISSGLLLNENNYWITFHGLYDLAYLLKVSSNLILPDKESSFYTELELYFNNYYDIKHLVTFTDFFTGSLSKLQSDCDIVRIGSQHQT